MAVEITGKYLGKLTAEAVHGPSGSKLLTTAPTDNGGTGEYFSPTDLCATSLATCMLITMGLWADKHGIDLTGTTYRVEKHMNPDPRRIGRLVVEFTVSGKAVAEDMRPRMEAAAHKCPVSRSLLGDVAVELAFQYK